MKKNIILILLIAVVIIVITVVKEDKLKDYKQQEYTITKGDTLWDIAEENCNKEIDIRRYISKIKEINNMETSDVYENQNIIILVKGDE